MFNKKSFLGFGILMAILAGSMALTWLDPVGIGRWVPDLEKVESAAIYSTEKNYVYSDTYQYNRFEITDKEEIAQLQEFHTILANTRPGRAAEIPQAFSAAFSAKVLPVSSTSGSSG